MSASRACRSQKQTFNSASGWRGIYSASRTLNKGLAIFINGENLKVKDNCIMEWK
jgi:hypothetical protein